MEPLAGAWETWVLRNGRQLRPPPPDFDAARFRAEAAALVRIRKSLTDEQKEIADSGPVIRARPCRPACGIR